MAPAGAAGQEVAGVWMTGIFECEVRQVRVVHIEHLVGDHPVTGDEAEFAEGTRPHRCCTRSRVVPAQGVDSMTRGTKTSRHPASIDPLAYVAGDLVTDRVQLLGKIVGSNGVPGLLTEQNHVIAYPCRGTWPQINHELVHADSSNHWPELTSDEHLAPI